MRIEIRSDSVILDGYVNAVDRYSRTINSPTGKFIEKIEPGAFSKALERAENVDLLLDHNKSRKLGSTKEGNLQLFEDNIGLRAICTVCLLYTSGITKTTKLAWIGQYQRFGTLDVIHR